MRISICAIIKDEHKFLKPWIDYHLSIGFSSIYLVEDFDSSSHKEITDLYNNVFLFSMRDITGCVQNSVTRQCAVYDWFSITQGDKCDWCAFIDVDEYVQIEEGDSLESIIKYCDDNDFHGLQVWWKCYGANNLIETNRGDLNNLYKDDYKPYVNCQNKITTYDYKHFGNMKYHETFQNCHKIKRGKNIHGVRSDIRQHFNEKTYDRIWINHYITKSWGDYVQRLKRGNITKGLRDIDFFFRVNENMRSMKEELSKDLDVSEFPTMYDK